MSQKRKHVEEDAPTASLANDVFRSARLEDRQSTFLGLFSPTLKPKELQALAEIESASHKILGWRKQSNQQSITKATQFVSGSDDDGEKYGGKKVEKILQELKMTGSCVVARWYGGVLLGPVRFAHMEQVAREAIEKWVEHEAEARQKKRKLEEDAAEHIRLSTSLSARDQNIVVLRELAVKKERELDEAKQGPDEKVDETKTVLPSQVAKSSAPAVVDYSAMPLDRLRALDKARDATLSFLLKRIDKAEAELAQYQTSTADEPP